jgi:hypothetical protein
VKKLQLVNVRNKFNIGPVDFQEETLAALELECKIQKGIAEAALGLANDTTASKTARRKHRLMYQQSRRRLVELEAKLDLLQQSNKLQHPKQRKKPRPPLDSGNNRVFTIYSKVCILGR